FIVTECILFKPGAPGNRKKWAKCEPAHIKSNWIHASFQGPLRLMVQAEDAGLKPEGVCWAEEKANGRHTGAPSCAGIRVQPSRSRRRYRGQRRSPETSPPRSCTVLGREGDGRRIPATRRCPDRLLAHPHQGRYRV